MPAPDPRLPSHIAPVRYELTLEPDIGSASFRGAVTIDVELLEPTAEIVCNAAELEIESARVILGEGPAATEHLPDIELDTDLERLRLVLAADLPAGPARVALVFRGTLNDQLRGFYRSTYTDDAGDEHTIATTQFQSTDARRAFPCWDEPAWKATFATTLVVEPDHLAIANTGLMADTIDPDGRRRLTFRETMRMSTYLVAFVVGPLEVTAPVDAGGVPVRVVHRPGQGHLTAFALDVATHALEWFADYYAIPYPSDKVDLLAIPDFAFGAMENLGCVTFREVLLLVDPDTASQPELQRVADVVNHELAHMWFGDLVTMKWWEGIWLNEAFATFMETSCSAAYRPEWEVWTTFGRARAAAFDVDALASTRPIEFPVVTPQDAEGMFDILTYEKGASVVRMLEQHLGPAVFREGVRHYLSTHAYANTETSDLWDSLEEVSGEPVRKMMDSWILQGGHPVVDATPGPDGLTIRQRHFTLDPTASDGRRWSTPVGIRLDHEGLITDHRVLLEPHADSVVLDAPGELVSANADGSGFYRVHPHTMRGPGRRNADERHGLVDDAWALTLAGEMEALEWLAVAESLADDTDLTVWQALTEGYRGLARIVVDDVGATAALRSRLVRVVHPALLALGLDRRRDESDRTNERRATIIGLLGSVAAHEPTIAAARDRLDAPDPTIAHAALAVVARHGDRAVADLIRARWREASDPQTEQRHLRARADLPDIDLVGEVLADILAGTVRTQDGPFVIQRGLTNPTAGPSVWEFVTHNWETLLDRFPSNSISRMLAGITALDTPAAVTDVAVFLAAHPVPQGARQIEQHLERQRINAALREREAERLAAAL